MKFDDIIGILFLLFFILGPALKGLFKPGEPLIEVELPEVETIPENAEPATNKLPQRTITEPPAQPTPAAPKTAEPPVREPVTAVRAAREATPRSLDQKLPDGGRRRVRKLGLKTDRRAVLNGMLWHEILSEPVAIKIRKRRQRGAKLG